MFVHVIMFLHQISLRIQIYIFLTEGRLKIARIIINFVNMLHTDNIILSYS